MSRYKLTVEALINVYAPPWLWRAYYRKTLARRWGR